MSTEHLLNQIDMTNYDNESIAATINLEESQDIG